MSIDGKFVYAVQYDDIDFSNNPKVYNERDYGLIRQGKGKYYRLFASNNTQNLPFVDNQSLLYNKFSDGYHNINILAWDFNNNSIELNATILCEPLSSFDIEITQIDNSWMLSTNPHDEIKPIFNLKTKYFDSKSQHIHPININQNQYLLENISEPFNILNISGNSYKGIPVTPQFLSLTAKQLPKIEGNININHFEHGVVIEFIETEFTGLSPQLVFEKGTKITKYNLMRLEQNILTSQVFMPKQLDGLTQISVVYPDDVNHQFNRSISSQVVTQLEKFELTNVNRTIKVKGDENTFYKTTFVWIEAISAPKPKEGKLVSNPVFVGPNYIPFENEITLEFTIPSSKEYSHYAIYYYDTQKNKWYYMDTKRNGRILSTTALSGEIFAVIRETSPPSISRLIPNNGGTYAQNGFDELSFYIDDSFSGVNGENDIEIILDGHPVIVRYNSYQKKVYYPFHTPLSVDKHTFTINVTDKVGNNQSLTGTFWVK
jgi:hypothetical protein